MDELLLEQEFNHLINCISEIQDDFQMHVEDRLDGTFFEMLALKRKIEKGEITPEQATQVIGHKLHQRYIPEQSQSQQPQAPTMTYEEYYRQTH